MPQFSCITLAIGAAQLVVQEAFDITTSVLFNSLSLIPKTIVLMSPFAGAEIITLFAPAAMCFSALGLSINKPVDSITASTPNSFHGRAAGSLWAVILICCPLILI